MPSTHPLLNDGQLLRGKLHIERALAVGAEISGVHWARANDGLRVNIAY
jgi:hypothetical protein